MAVLKPIFIIPLDLGTIATGNQAAGYPATNLNRAKAIGLTWRTTDALNVWARGQFAASRAIDFCSMVSANALPATTIRVRLGDTQGHVDGTANLIPSGEQNAFDHANWTKTGTVVVTPNVVNAPDGNTTADQIAGLNTGNNYIARSMAGGGTNGDPNDVDVWVQRISTAGVLELSNPQGGSFGLYQVDLAALGGGWNRLNKQHPAVTVVNPFQQSAGNTGLLIRAVSGGPLSIHAWGAGVWQGQAPFESLYQPFISPAVTRASGLYHSHLEAGLTGAYSATWWRIDITGHTGAFEASTLVLGKTITPSRFYNLDFERGIRDLGSLEFSRYGVFDEEEGAIFRTLDFTLGWQTEAEMEASFLPMMEKLATRGVIHVVFDPEATTYRQSKTYLGVMAKPPGARGNKKPATFSQDFQIISMI